MNEIQRMLTERVDDMPLLLEQMQRMNLPTLIDKHFPTHGHWPGLSLGWVSTIWLSAIWSRGDHRLVHVDPWVATRLWTLRTATGQAVERLDCTDDRLEIVLRRLRDDTRWAQLESTRNQHTVRVYDWPTERMHVESTSASAYASVTDEGLLQFGQSKDHRPDLPQGKVMQAVLDPLGLPWATDVVSGARADDPLSIPCIPRVQASLGRTGLLSVGDGKMAARERRAFSASKGDDSLCPLPQVPLADGEWAEACEAIGSGTQALLPVLREPEEGEPALIAQGYERSMPMELEVDGQRQRWTERRLVVRSVRHAKAAEAALRARVATAKAQVEAFNQRGRGRKRFAEVAALRQAAHEIVQRHGGEDCLWLRYEQPWMTRRVRAYRDRPAQVTADRQAPVEVRVDEEALEATVRRVGWRMYGTNQPQEQLSLAQAVLASRQESLVERSVGRLKGSPRSLSPMYGQRDEHATGLMRLLSIGLRVFTLLEGVARRQLTAAGATLAGLYAGNAKRDTTRPTAERLLEALQEVTLTVVEGVHQTYGPFTALSPLQKRMLELLSVSSQVYTRLCTVSHEPP